ncbi:MAG: hypothetical protein M3Q49_16720 [Actinomycetota bacterium]|nr:hypothetical protein [Actinomycetota bacterium]
MPTRPGADDVAALVEELRGLREAVDGMSERLEALERENRELREAVAPVPVEGEAVEGERLEVPEAPPRTLWGRLRGLVGR